MNKIGFKNFRIFEELPSIDLGGITVLVGGNNTGKSTLVKGALLMHDFIQTKKGDDKDSQSITGNDEIAKPLFMLDSKHVNLGNFYRAICRNKSNNGRTISFEYGLDEFTINVAVKGSRKSDNAPEAEVSSIGINDSLRNIEININYNENRIKIKFGVCEDENEIKEISKRIEKNLSILRHKKDFAYFIYLQDNKPIDSFNDKEYKAEIEQLNKELEALKNKSTYQEKVATIVLDEVLGYQSNGFLLSGLICAIKSYVDDDRSDLNLTVSNNSPQVISPKEIIKNRVHTLSRMAERLSSAINNDVAEYIHAQSAIHQDYYNITQNPNDYATRAIYEYCQAGIVEGDEEYDLICQWLSEFEIGTSFVATSKEDGTCHVKVIDSKIKGGIDLSDMGIGSNQIIILLLRIATIIHNNKNANVTIMVEDPERYLYPALQCKLADFLWDVYIHYGINFVVETHSEYLIRESQVIVAATRNKKLSAAKAFKVNYLDRTLGCYSMHYQPNGKFDYDFGPGFFDVADNVAMELFDIEDLDYGL